MSKWSPIVVAVALLGAAGGWWFLDRDRDHQATRLRVVQRLDRPANVTPLDPVKLAAGAAEQWTAEQIETQWTRLGSTSSQTYRSPELAGGKLFAIVVEFAGGSTAHPATLLWSTKPVLTPQDFARNRQELRASDRAHSMLLSSDGLQLDREPLQHLFLHVPEGGQLAASLAKLAVVRWSDVTQREAIGPFRATLGREVREVIAARSNAPISHRLPDGKQTSLSFGVFVESRAQVRITADSDRRVLFSGAVAPGAWDDFTMPVGDSTDRELTFEAEFASSPAAIYWSTPLVLQPDDELVRPNIVLYVVDALRADALGAYGAAPSRTPDIDALAREGLVFERAYAAASWTKPSVTTLLTSLYSMTHGLGTRFYSDQLPPTVWTLQHSLASAGYATAQFSANPFTGSLSNLDRGFDSAMIDAALSRAGSQVAETGRAAELHRAFLSWLSTRANQRFFAYVHPVDTHPPFAVRATTPREAYDASLASLDREIGALRRALATLGLEGKTLFILTADHGEAFGEHGRNGHGQSVYDEEVRVPWVMHWPGRLAAGRIADPVSHVDLAPTILAAAGIAAPPHLQGRSLWPTDDSRRPSPVVTTRSIYPEDIDNPLSDPAEAVAIVDYPWKLIRSERANGRYGIELYQLDVDPGERRDRSTAEAARAQTLLTALERFLSDQRSAREQFAASQALATPPLARPPSRELLDRLRSLGYVR